MFILEIILKDGQALIIGIVIVIILWGLFDSNNSLKQERFNSYKKSTDLENQIEILKKESINNINEQSLIFQKKEIEHKAFYQNWAYDEFEKFKKREIEKIKEESERLSLEAATVLLQKWKIENEAKIRQDAILRSYSVNLGKITEHLIPFHESFLSQFNPKDARFIGSPIDLIVFDGYSDKKEEINIYIVEIKTGNSKLTDNQKKIRASVLNGNIRWAEINPDKLVIPVLPFKEESTNEIIKKNESQKSDGELFTEDMIFKFKSLENEDMDMKIQRMYDCIENVMKLYTEEKYTFKSAILKSINDFSIVFESNENKIHFIKKLEKFFSP